MLIDLTAEEANTAIEACRIARLFLGMVESTISGAQGGADDMYRRLATVSQKLKVNPAPIQVPVNVPKRRKK